MQNEVSTTDLSEIMMTCNGWICETLLSDKDKVVLAMNNLHMQPDPLT